VISRRHRIRRSTPCASAPSAPSASARRCGERSNDCGAKTNDCAGSSKRRGALAVGKRRRSRRIGPRPTRDVPGASRAPRMDGRHTAPYPCTSTRGTTRRCPPCVRTVRDQWWKRPSQRSTKKTSRPSGRSFARSTSTLDSVSGVAAACRAGIRGKRQTRSAPRRRNWGPRPSPPAHTCTRSVDCRLARSRGSISSTLGSP